MSPRFRRSAVYGLTAAAIAACIYTLVVAVSIGTTVVQSDPSMPLDIGTAIVLLVYIAMPITVVLLSLRYLIDDRAGQKSGLVITALAFFLGAVQLIWLVDVWSRSAREPPSFVAAATAGVIAFALLDLMRTIRATKSRSVGT